MVRLKDVARYSKVGEATVSRVVNGTKFVSPETRDRVLQALKELNYLGNAQARQLARGSSDFMGLIVSDIENPFLPSVIKAFESAARAAGFDVLMATTNYDDAQTERSLKTMIRHKVRAVAVMTSQIRPDLAMLLEAQEIPSVFLDSSYVGTTRSAVRLDYSSGAREAVSHLRHNGHREIAILAGPQSRASHVAYLEAVLHACAELDMRPRVMEAMNTVDGGNRAIAALLAQEAAPTAVMCGNDLAAIGALRALTEAGLRVPDDVSLIGADDIAFCELTSPPLTTIRIPRADLGETAFRILEACIAPDGPSADVCLPTSLVIRGSVGPVQVGAASVG